jgi:hypothetical protein
MTRRLRIFLSAIALVGGVLVTHAPAATAIGFYRTDGNDVKGALDLASVRLNEINGGDRFTIRTVTAFTATQLNGRNGWVEVDIDVNADRHFEYWVAVFYNNGRLRAVQGRGDRGVRYVPVHRVDKRAVSFDLAHRYLGSSGSFDFATFSVWRASPCSKRNPCVDAIPNRYPLLRHDWKPPTIAWDSVPASSTDASDTLSFPVSFTVHDNKYGSGLDHWALQRSADGGPWVTVKTGHVAAPVVSVTGEEGAHYDFRVVAVDRQKNTSIKAGQSTDVPWDDANATAFSYSNPPTTATGLPGPFLATTSTVANTDTITVTLAAGVSNLCVLGGPASAAQTSSVDVTIDGNPLTTFTENDTTSYLTPQCTNAPVAAGTLVLTVTTAEPFVFDGLVVHP